MTPSAEHHPAQQRRPWLARTLLFAWGAGVLVVLSSLMTGHWVPLPVPPTDDAALRAGLQRYAPPATDGRWAIVHVLYAKCRCSRRVFDYLAERSSPDDVDEVVLLVGGDDADLEAACGARAIGLHKLTDEQLERQLGIEAAPLFIVRDPLGEPRYTGGYTDRKQGLDYQDLATLAQLREGATVPPRPVFGCGVSSSLQDALDPLGLKY